MRIQLLGRPTISLDAGKPAELRGMQVWAVLARVLLADRPVSRRSLATEIFPHANDPLGALRWCLASLRRVLGRQTFLGDPVVAHLAPGTRVDLYEIDADDFDLVSAGEFLEGMDPASDQGFAAWLAIERERWAVRRGAAARHRALSALSRADWETAASLARVCIEVAPFDEAAHILLIEALAHGGRHEAAEEHVNRTEAVFLAELGTPPSAALQGAARKATASFLPRGVSSKALARSLLQAGKAALAAGASEAGLDSLRSAVAHAETARDIRLHALTHFELGMAFVHTVRGRDDEGAVHLRRTAELARDAGDALMAANALREIGYVDALVGRRPSAARILTEAMDCAGGDHDALAGVHAAIGFNLVDWGRPAEGLEHFQRAIDHAHSASSDRRAAWALGIGAWGQLRTGDAANALDWLRRCLGLCGSLRWVAFEPWPRALIAEAELMRGKSVAAGTGLEDCFAMSCQLADPCWEAATARALALAAEAGGAPDEAARWLDDAWQRGTRVNDAYAGLTTAILADRARIATVLGDPDAERRWQKLLEHAARTHAEAYLALALESLRGGQASAARTATRRRAPSP